MAGIGGLGDLASNLVSFQIDALRYRVVAAAARAAEEPRSQQILTQALVKAGDDAAASASRVVASGLGSTLGGNLDVRL